MDAQTIYNKIAAVPTPISTWFGSDAFVASIEKMDEQFTLPPGSSTVISKLIQGFEIKDIAPEYFSGELASALNLEKDKAVHITGEIKKTIFSPIKKDLADYGINIDLLDKFQMPVIASSISDTPKIIQDISLSSPSSVSQPIKPVPLPVNKMAAPAPANLTPRQPATTSDIGWSRPQAQAAAPKPTIAPPAPRLAPTQPSMAQPVTPPPALTPKTAPISTPVSPAPTSTVARASTPASSALSEFDRLNISPRKSPLTGPAPAGAHPPIAVPPMTPTVSVKPATTLASATTPASVAPIDPPPVMLHEDTTFKAAEKNTNFKFSSPNAGAQMQLDSTGIKAPTRPAVLEFGGAAAAPSGSASNARSSASLPGSTSASAGGGPSFVNPQRYSEFRPSLSSTPTANSGPRNVSEVVTPIPQRPAPMNTNTNSIPGGVPVPRPPQRTQPPQPPVARPQVAQPPTQPPQPPQKDQVITKNFL